MGPQVLVLAPPRFDGEARMCTTYVFFQEKKLQALLLVDLILARSIKAHAMNFLFIITELLNNAVSVIMDDFPTPKPRIS